MIGFLKKRKQKKQIKEYFQAARHARNMREDIADPEKLQAISEAEKAVLESLEKNSEELEKALKSLEKAVDEVYPYKLRTGIRENVEVIIVALAAAMAIRAFFFQPFKIPTGSMQPTLNGITTQYRKNQTGPISNRLNLLNGSLPASPIKRCGQRFLGLPESGCMWPEISW